MRRLERAKVWHFKNWCMRTIFFKVLFIMNKTFISGIPFLQNSPLNLSLHKQANCLTGSQIIVPPLRHSLTSPVQDAWKKGIKALWQTTYLGHIVQKPVILAKAWKYFYTNSFQQNGLGRSPYVTHKMEINYDLQHFDLHFYNCVQYIAYCFFIWLKICIAIFLNYWVISPPPPIRFNRSRVLTSKLLSAFTIRNVQTLSSVSAFSSNLCFVVLVNWQFGSLPLTFSL